MKNDFAICVFSFCRPHYLSQCIQSLGSQYQPGPFDFHVFQDGHINKFSKREAASQLEINKCIAIASKAPFLIKQLHVRDYNYGIGIQQYEAYDWIAKHYRWALWLEDDVICSPYFVRISRLLIPFLEKDPGAFSATPSFRLYSCTSEQIKNELKHVEIGGSVWFGYLADMSKWPQLKTKFDEYYGFVRDVDYRARPQQEILEWFKACGWSGKGTSQDGGKEASLQFLKMRRYRLRVNRGMYVGEIGEHSKAELFNRQGWRSFAAYIHETDREVNQLELV